jgi:succinyl-diaminopimelate desuccinylase
MMEDMSKTIKDRLDRKRILELASTLVGCDSVAPPGKEYEASGRIAEILSDIGLDVTLQHVDEKRFNVIARMKGTGGPATLMYSGHIDVVPAGDEKLWKHPPFRCMQEGGLLYGRGTCDMKGGIASVIHAVELVKDSGIRLGGNLVVAIDVDEEVQNLGMKKIISEGLKADCCIVGEPTNLEIAISHRGVISFLVAIRGKMAHASQACEGINAINGANAFISSIVELNRRCGLKTHPRLGNTTYNVTTIRGGIKNNIIPDICELTVDCRMLPDEDRASCEEAVAGIISGLKSECGDFDCTYEVYTYCPPAQAREDLPIVRSLQKSILQTGREPVIKGFEATCEASLITQYLGIPCVIFGPGSIAQAHIADEYVKIEQLMDASVIYAETFIDMLR